MKIVANPLKYNILVINIDINVQNIWPMFDDIFDFEKVGNWTIFSFSIEGY